MRRFWRRGPNPIDPHFREGALTLAVNRVLLSATYESLMAEGAATFRTTRPLAFADGMLPASA